MKQNQSEAGRFSDRGQGLGTVTEAMVRERAGEIAAINGRGGDINTRGLKLHVESVKMISPDCSSK